MVATPTGEVFITWHALEWTCGVSQLNGSTGAVQHTWHLTCAPGLNIGALAYDSTTGELLISQWSRILRLDPYRDAVPRVWLTQEEDLGGIADLEVNPLGNVFAVDMHQGLLFIPADSSRVTLFVGVPWYWDTARFSLAGPGASSCSQ